MCVYGKKIEERKIVIVEFYTMDKRKAQKNYFEKKEKRKTPAYQNRAVNLLISSQVMRETNDFLKNRTIRLLPD